MIFLANMDQVQRATKQLHGEFSPAKVVTSGDCPGAAPEVLVQATLVLSVMERELFSATSLQREADAALRAHLARTAYGT